jgi:outer membrane protein assembly factor BamB
MRYDLMNKLKAITVLVILLWISLSANSLADSVGITVSEDRRVHLLDLNTFEVIRSSPPYPEIGNPTSIDFDPRDGRLFIGSEGGYWQKTYYPLVVVNIQENTFKLGGKYTLEEGKPVDGYLTVWAVYRVRLSKDGKKIFLGYANPKYSGGSIVFNVSENKIERLLTFYIDENDLFSEDGNYLYIMRPPTVRKLIQDGKELERRITGAVTTYDLRLNKMVRQEGDEMLFKTGQGLNPPGRKLSYPLMSIEENHVLRAFDRFNGKEIWRIELDGIALREFPVLCSNNQKALVPMSTGKIVVIDLKEKRIVSNINIGSPMTNVICY